MNYRPALALAAALMASTAAALPATAEETPFAGIDTADLPAAGETEAEQWISWKHGRPGQSFDAVDGQTELEYGVTSDLKLGAYIKYGWSRARPHAPAGASADTGADFRGVAAEVVYRLWDADTHPFGAAIYFEPTIGPDSRELEWKLLLHKSLFDERLVLAANLVLENEWERVSSSWGTHSEFSLLAGAAYRFTPDWAGGVEFESKREFDGLLPWQSSNAAANSYFVGPTLHYASEDFFVTLGVQAQLPWAQNLSGVPGETIGGYAHEEERYRVRMRIGFEL